MKNLLLYIFCNISIGSFAQVHSAMPPEANTFYTNAMRSINPEIKHLIEKNALALKSRNVNTDSLFGALQKEPLLKKNNSHDLEAITVLIMVQVSKNADADLKTLVMNMRKNNDQSSPESNGTLAILEHKSRIAENVSRVMKKVSASQESAINNLK